MVLLLAGRTLPTPFIEKIIFSSAISFLLLAQIYAEAESRANVFAMPRRNSICGPPATNSKTYL